MAVRIQFRRGTAAEWASANPTLAAGELGYETDSAAMKIGDGATAWDALSYSAVSEQYVADAIADVVGLSPETLDTLEELALAIGDDPDFANTITAGIGTAVSDHNGETLNVHGIADTSALETTTGAQNKANLAQSNAASYTDNAISDLVSAAPGTLDTLNELAAALGDDPNFATTITTSLGTKLTFIADSSTNFVAANAVTSVNTIYYETDLEGYIKYGDGVTAYNDLLHVGHVNTANQIAAHNDEQLNVHGIDNTANLAYQSDISSVSGNVISHVADTVDVHGIGNTANLAYQSDITAISDTVNVHSDLTTSVHGISDTANLAYLVDVSAVSDLLDTHAALTLNVHGISDTSALATNQDISDTVNAISDHSGTTLNVHGIENTALLATTSDISTHNSETISVHGIANTAELVIASDLTTAIGEVYQSPTFAGTVVLPADTSIGNVSAAELLYMDGVTGPIQDQIDAKLTATVAASTYAPLASPTFTGTVVLPADTSIDGVSATELSYLNNVSSAIQTQIDAKAPIDSPTFTGTVAGITKAMVGLGNVTNTSDANKPISTATQAALDAKAALAGAVFTGNVEAADVTVTGNLYVQGATTTVSTSNLSLRDNMLYLNQAGLFTLTDAAGDGTNVIYTVDGTHDLSTGDFITVTGVTPSSFDISGEGLEIIATTSDTITVASTVTDTYTSGGSLRGKVHANPDLGWAAGRYDVVNGSGYAHAGIFRDASDGVFKFFDGYTPEPDESVFIDTTHASFALTSVEVAGLITESVTFADGSVQTAAGVASITGFTEKTASYQLDTLDHKDNVVEMNSASATTFTIPLEATFSWPVGASMDIIQTGAGQVTIDIEATGTLNYTPGNKLRTQWSSCTIMKRAADTWILYGDLTA